MERAGTLWDDGRGFEGHLTTAADGFLISAQVERSGKTFWTDSGSKDRISVQVNRPLSEGAWKVESGEVAVVYSVGRLDAEKQPSCVGLASGGSVRVLELGHTRAIISVDLNIDFIEIEHKKPLCEPGRLSLDFEAEIITS